jgi:hypothetical protein
MGYAMELPSEGSQLGNRTPEGQEFIFGKWAETSEMGSEQHAKVSRRLHSACKGTSFEQERILGTDTYVHAAVPEVR